MSFAFSDRSQTLQKLKTTEYDLVIIGGGITGAGVARDAASRGMKVALVEEQDFAQGTSSRSSKLIHGGIRYLENLEFHLVFEALSERALLFQIAPHLVHPLRFLLPLYKEGRVGMFKMGLGMWLYDALSLFRAPQLHERLNAKKSVERISILQSQKLLGSYVYSDAYMDDDRLVLETLRSAQKLGAHLVSYVQAMSAQFSKPTAVRTPATPEEKITSITCKDQISGDEFQIRGRHFISTVGPWTDEVGSRFLKNWKKILRPSKGIHITLDRNRLPLPCAVVLATGTDNRIVFGIPRHDMIIIGTTDTDFSGDPKSVKSDAADVAYLLKVVDQYFPGAKLTKEDILASYAGVRPLVHDGSSTESKTSREHIILCDPRNVTFVAGGKYTTYRRMAEQTVDKVLKTYFSKKEKSQWTASKTKNPLNEKVSVSAFAESQTRVQELVQQTQFPLAEVQVLVDRHGLEAFDIVKRYFRPEMKSIWEMEAHFAIDESHCGHLSDFYLRRAPLFLSRKDHGYSLIETLSHIFAKKLNWDESERKANINSVLKHEEFELSWKSRI